VSIRVLDEHMVRQLLPMDECIEVMAEALAALARGEVHNPLRFVVRPPDAPSLMGLMPAYRGGTQESDAAPLWGLKSVVIAPANAARGLDLHQGFVALFDGETGETRAIMNAGGITAVRTAAVTAVATRLLARDGSKTLAILGAGIQGKANLEAMRAVLDFDRVLAWSRTPGRAAAELDGVEEVATVEEAVRDADVVVTATSAPEPILRREWLKAGAHVNAVGSSIPTTRELDTQTMADAALFVDRRESTVNEAGDFLFPQREGAIGPDHIRAEIGELLIGAAEGRRSDDELTVFKSLGLAVEDLAAAEHVLRRAEAENVGAVVSL
jgi:ornithine cyclodeaminase/alanine dehydrogenase-like protein (mu-crystallin family)